MKQVKKPAIIEAALLRATFGNQRILIISPTLVEAKENFEATKLLAHKRGRKIASINQQSNRIVFSNGSIVYFDGSLYAKDDMYKYAGCVFSTIIFDEEVNILDSDNVRCGNKEAMTNKLYLSSRVR